MCKIILMIVFLATAGVAQVQNLNQSDVKTVTTIKNERINLAQSGKIVILDFFMTSCSHCQLHSPHLADISRRYSSDLKVISFAADGRANPAMLAEYIKAYRVTNPVVNMSNDIAMAFTPKVRDVPQMLIYNQQGVLVKTILGWREENKQVLENYIKALLPEPKPIRRARK